MAPPLTWYLSGSRTLPLAGHARGSDDWRGPADRVSGGGRRTEAGGGRTGRGEDPGHRGSRVHRAVGGTGPVRGRRLGERGRPRPVPVPGRTLRRGRPARSRGTGSGCPAGPDRDRAPGRGDVGTRL